MRELQAQLKTIGLQKLFSQTCEPVAGRAFVFYYPLSELGRQSPAESKPFVHHPLLHIKDKLQKSRRFDHS